MTISTYDELTTELAAWLNRDDLSDRIPTFIRLFEARMNRRLRSPQMEIGVTQSMTSGDFSYALPSDFRMARRVFLQGTPGANLEPMSEHNLREFYPDSSVTGKPVAYAIFGQNIVFGPTPDDAYSFTLSYFREVPALDSSNTTNWLLSTHPDAYLFGSLAAAEAYLINDDRVLFWKSGLDEAMAEIIEEANTQRLPAGPLTLRPTVIE